MATSRDSQRTWIDAQARTLRSRLRARIRRRTSSSPRSLGCTSSSSSGSRADAAAAAGPCREPIESTPSVAYDVDMRCDMPGRPPSSVSSSSSSSLDATVLAVRAGAAFDVARGRLFAALDVERRVSGAATAEAYDTSAGR